MKLVTIGDRYVSPNPRKGTFPNAFIKDFKKIIEEESFMVYFGLYWIKNGREIQVDETSLYFDENSERAYIGLNQKGQSEDGQPIFQQTKPLLEFIQQGGDLSQGVITDIGYPSYAIAKSFFDGGSIDRPEIHLSNKDRSLREVAKHFILNTLAFEGEAVGKQFKFETI